MPSSLLEWGRECISAMTSVWGSTERPRRYPDGNSMPFSSSSTQSYNSAVLLMSFLHCVQFPSEFHVQYRLINFVKHFTFYTFQQSSFQYSSQWYWKKPVQGKTNAFFHPNLYSLLLWHICNYFDLTWHWERNRNLIHSKFPLEIMKTKKSCWNP